MSPNGPRTGGSQSGASPSSAKALPWLRLYSEFATDPDVQSLAFEDQRHFVMALCLKGNGVLDKDYPSEERRAAVIAQALGLDQVSAAEAERRLIEAGLIRKGWQPRGWEKRQFHTDVSTDRVRLHRQREAMKRGETVSGTAPDTDTDTEKEEAGPTGPRSPSQSRNGDQEKAVLEAVWTAVKARPDCPVTLNRELPKAARVFHRQYPRFDPEAFVRATTNLLRKVIDRKEPIDSVYGYFCRALLGAQADGAERRWEDEKAGYEAEDRAIGITRRSLTSSPHRE